MQYEINFNLILLKYMLKYATKIYDELIPLHNILNYYQVNNFKTDQIKLFFMYIS